MTFVNIWIIDLLQLQSEFSTGLDFSVKEIGQPFEIGFY